MQTLRQSEETVKAGLAGRANPQAVVEALAATELAVQTAVAVRDKVVEAYQGDSADAGVRPATSRSVTGAGEPGR